MAREKVKKLIIGIGIVGLLVIVGIVVRVLLMEKQKVFSPKSEQPLVSIPSPKKEPVVEEKKEETKEGKGSLKEVENLGERKEIFQFSGKGNGKTNVFFIENNEWVLSVNLSAPPKLEFQPGEPFAEVLVYKEGKEEPIQIFKRSSEEYIPELPNNVGALIPISEGNGNFYVEIKTNESISWEIKVRVP